MLCFWFLCYFIRKLGLLDHGYMFEVKVILHEDWARKIEESAMFQRIRGAIILHYSSVKFKDSISRILSLTFCIIVYELCCKVLTCSVGCEGGAANVTTVFADILGHVARWHEDIDLVDRQWVTSVVFKFLQWSPVLQRECIYTVTCYFVCILLIFVDAVKSFIPFTDFITDLFWHCLAEMFSRIICRYWHCICRYWQSLDWGWLSEWWKCIGTPTNICMGLYLWILIMRTMKCLSVHFPECAYSTAATLLDGIGGRLNDQNSTVWCHLPNGTTGWSLM